jgi:photosystem II stability/assembly factor-like uncharacterized protein
MTLERDLDRRLAAWLDERAVAAPPADLLARSLARVDATGQGGAWRFPSAVLRGPAAAGRPVLPAWAILVLVALVAVALVVAGTEVVRHYLAVVPLPPSPALTVDSTQPPETPTPIDTSPPGLPAQAGMFATAQDIVAVGDQVAWVATTNGIYRTDDTGKTWRSVQPNGWTLPYTEAFLDAETAYVPIGSGSEIAVTHDGGASWATTVLDAPVLDGPGSVLPVFAFSSPSTGYITFADPNHFAKRDGTGLFVFGTTDGGRTWTGPTHGLQPYLKATSNKLYAALGPFLVNSAGLSQQYAFENYFDLSEDGGATYTRYDFPTGPLAPKKDMKVVDGIVRGPDGHLLIAISVDAGRTLIPETVYRNGDDPSSWTKVDELPPGNEQPFQFLTGNTWIVTAGAPTEILSTSDAGAHWRTVVPAISLYGVQAGVGRASWGSVETGWVMEECRELNAQQCGDKPRDLVLLVTTDGGATWTQVGS